MLDAPINLRKVVIRHAIASAIVLLFMGIWWFDGLAEIIEEQHALNLIMFFVEGLGSGLIVFVVMQGIELIKGGKSFSWGSYILFSSVLSLIIIWMITRMLGQVFTAT